MADAENEPPAAAALLIPFDLIFAAPAVRSATDGLIQRHFFADRIRFAARGMVITAELILSDTILQKALLPCFDERSAASMRPVPLSAADCRLLLRPIRRRRR
jgi:hypothetical protein